VETRPSSGVGVRWQPIALVVLALAGAWLVGRYGGDGTSAELTLDQPLTPLAQAAAQPTAPTQSQPQTQAAAPGVATSPAAQSQQTTSRLASERSVTTPTSETAAPPTTPPAGSVEEVAASPPHSVDPSEADADRGLARQEPPPPDAPIEGLSTSAISGSANATTARVTWTTNFPTTSQGADGIGTAPSVWTAPTSTPAFTHELEFAHLNPGTTYHLWLHDIDEWNRPLTTPLIVTTAPRAGSTAATVGNGAILVNGDPFFPLTTWNTCTNSIADRIALGFNLFMGEGCGHENRLAGALDGKALAVVDAKTKLANEPGIIGWYYPDELDGRLSAPLSADDITKLAVTPPDGMLSFLTLTNHFFTGAAPLSIGRTLYPTFASIANVVGFDLYPMQNWCRNDAFQTVYDAQRELGALAAGKPTFQWIEARRMDCSAATSPTPATVAAETWLAIAGGADGIGYFPDEWSPAIGDEIGALNARIADLAPALLAPETPATAPPPIKVGARTLNGALYVIAVNSSTASFDVQLQVDGAGTRTFDVVGEGRQATATDNAISDHFDGLGVHIYVAAPAGWTRASLPR
jgi:hypothetical protein